MRRLAALLVIVGSALVVSTGTAIAQTQSASLEMTADSVRDFLPAGVEFVSATPSQGACAVHGRADLGVPYNPTNGYDSDIVECDLGSIASGGSATVDVTVTPEAVGEITNIAADFSEAIAKATVVVE
jgi:hypothetical protein